ncbi:MAG TPA: flagellar export chaperone FlgN [Solirubrobacteraceae bacterium]|jgi:hypothetical protein|nr:flagellar export chaperone FlgN [Solirubrobacteraceae bacterium]
MSLAPTGTPLREPDEALTLRVLVHLDAQVASVRGLLEIVLEQGAAIRARDVHEVVRLAGMLHGELSRRELIEQERSRLLHSSAMRLGIEPGEVTLTRLTGMMDPDCAEQALKRSAELRGLLHELQREHSCNRALMQLELSFLDHLMRSLALDGAVHDYDPQGSTAPRPGARVALHVLDLEA